MDKAAIYCRLSREDTEKNAESESIRNQKAMLSAFAVEKGWEVFDIYCDEDYSGTDPGRPEFNRMLRDAEQGRFRIVLCKTQSRFTRDMELVEKYLHKLFPLWGIRFVAVVDNVDTALDGNKKARQINGLINEWYLEDLSENIRSVLTSKRRQGKYIGSVPLYGYRKDPSDHNALVIDPESAEVIRRVFQLYVSGHSAAEIAEQLNRDGIPNPTAYKQAAGLLRPRLEMNTRWTNAAIRSILGNRMYAGDMVQGVHRNASFKVRKQVRVAEGDWIVVPDTHKSIIDREIFQRAQALRERTPVRRRSPNRPSPLSGKVGCILCGGPMRQNSAKGITYLRCARRRLDGCGRGVRLDVLEAALLERMRLLLGRYGDREEIARRIAPKGIGKRRARLDGLERRRSALDGELARLYTDRVGGVVSEEQFKILSRHIERERKAAQEELARIRIKAEPEALPCVLERYLHPEALGKMAAELIERVEAGKDNDGVLRLDIHWAI